MRRVVRNLLFPTQRVQLCAQHQAQCSVSDGEARAALSTELNGITRATIDRELANWTTREDYVTDRAYRLLVGVRSEKVPPIALESRERFTRDAELGHRPLPVAFARLDAIEPGLEPLGQQALKGGLEASLQAIRGLDQLRTPQSVIRDDVPFGIALNYLRQTAAGPVDQRTYFEQTPVRHLFTRIDLPVLL
jgi:hypothetical protein